MTPRSTLVPLFELRHTSTITLVLDARGRRNGPHISQDAIEDGARIVSLLVARGPLTQDVDLVIVNAG